MINRDPITPEAVNEKAKVKEVIPAPGHRLSDETYRQVKELEALKRELTVPGCENDPRMDELQKQIEELWVSE